jgi:hypothetical protein
MGPFGCQSGTGVRLLPTKMTVELKKSDVTVHERNAPNVPLLARVKQEMIQKWR